MLAYYWQLYLQNALQQSGGALPMPFLGAPPFMAAPDALAASQYQQQAQPQQVYNGGRTSADGGRKRMRDGEGGNSAKKGRRARNENKVGDAAAFDCCITSCCVNATERGADSVCVASGVYTNRFFAHDDHAGVQQLRLVQHALLAQGQAHRPAAVQCVRPVLRQERQAPTQRAFQRLFLLDTFCIEHCHTLSFGISWLRCDSQAQAPS